MTDCKAWLIPSRDSVVISLGVASALSKISEKHPEKMSES